MICKNLTVPVDFIDGRANGTTLLFSLLKLENAKPVHRFVEFIHFFECWLFDIEGDTLFATSDNIICK